MTDDIYAVYDKDTSKLVNIIVYDGIAEYDETVFHGDNAKKVYLPEEDRNIGIGIDSIYINEQFEKV